jgi:pyruvate,water dikinase
VGPVVEFEGYEPDLRGHVGGKAASLGELTVAGFPVPPGFAVMAEAFAPLAADEALAGAVEAVCAMARAGHTERIETVARVVRARAERAILGADLDTAVTAAYSTLCARCGEDDVAVAVRSSATNEDSADASFAGSFDSFLGVRGAEDVVRHVIRCWASQWTTRALCYRARVGDLHAAAAMAVVVQKLVRTRASGVAFTLNPANGDRSQIAIDASWGLGPAVVSGEVTPDHYLVDKVMFEITARRISPKTVEYRVENGRVERRAISAPRSASPCLADEHVRAVAGLARRVERHFGSPQDVEWAIDADRGAPGNVVLLQARPETVWSRQPARPMGRTASPAHSIVATLCAPLQQQGPG